MKSAYLNRLDPLFSYSLFFLQVSQATTALFFLTFSVSSSSSFFLFFFPTLEELVELIAAEAAEASPGLVVEEEETETRRRSGWFLFSSCFSVLKVEVDAIGAAEAEVAHLEFFLVLFFWRNFVLVLVLRPALGSFHLLILAD